MKRMGNFLNIHMWKTMKCIYLHCFQLESELFPIWKAYFLCLSTSRPQRKTRVWAPKYEIKACVYVLFFCQSCLIRLNMSHIYTCRVQTLIYTSIYTITLCTLYLVWIRLLKHYSQEIKTWLTQRLQTQEAWRKTIQDCATVSQTPHHISVS